MVLNMFVKKSFVICLLVLTFFTGIFFTSCKTDADPLPGTTPANTNPESNTPSSNSNFWGIWVRMDNGKEYEILETTVLYDKKSYAITSCTADSLAVASLGTFKKESDRVMVCDKIPYYRKGGTNLEYSLKLVGFSSSTVASARSAATVLSGVKGRGKSKKYPKSEVESVSDSEGIIKFKAPTVNDVQTVEITSADSVVVVPDLTINNSGDYMGTVALVGKDDYNLKITGTISENQKDNGYLYGNEAKSYEMELTITNISQNDCSTSACFVESEDPNLKLKSLDGTDLSGFTISTLKGGATKKIKLSLSYGKISNPYVDTGISVTLQNPFTGQEWKDYVPLRFYKGLIPIAIAAKSPEDNNKASLNGFIIYPDGNNQYFTIENKKSKVLYVPSFGSKTPFMLVFSGASVTQKLSDSTEMYYTVEPGKIVAKDVVVSGKDILKFIPFGGNNHSENSAYTVTEGFEAYLREGEIDYYSITTDSNKFYAPEGSMLYTVSFVNEKGEAPETFLVKDGTTLTEAQLPVMLFKDYEFLGWYSGDSVVRAGSFEVRSNVELKAKWQLRNYQITYQLAGGSNNIANPSSYTIETKLMELLNPVRNGYSFDGWYKGSVTSGNKIEKIGGGASGAITLCAKWTPVKYSITYETNGGTNSASNPADYTIETENITLAPASKTGFAFGGWFTKNDFSGTKQTAIAKGNTGNKCYYAKWLKACTVNYVTEHGTAPGSIIIGETDYFDSSQLPVLTDANYLFKGWYVGTTKVTAGSYKVTGDVTLTAKWAEKYTVTYVNNAHGTAPKALEVETGTTLAATALPKLTEKGWKFRGWYTDSTFTESTKVSAGYKVTASVTLYAKWEEFNGPDDSYVFVKGGTVVGDSKYNSYYSGVFPYGRTVTLSSFYMCEHEVTQSEYTAVMGSNPSNFSSSPLSGEIQGNRPVEYVSWYDAIYFCNKKSVKDGYAPCYSVNGNTDTTKWNYTPNAGNSISGVVSCNFNASGYRLPTEAEWEFAARGGTETYGKTAFANYFAGAATTNPSALTNSDLAPVGWYAANSSNKTHEVKKKTANALGLYDMSGNVREWCWDWHGTISSGTVNDPTGAASGSNKSIRGGSYYSNAYCCSVSYRSSDSAAANRYSNLGFRLVCSADVKTVTYITAHGTAPQKNGYRDSLDSSVLPQISERGWIFKGWYTDSTFAESSKVSAGYKASTDITLYAKWEEFNGPGDSYVFVKGGTVVGDSKYNSYYTGVFPSGRTVTLSSFYMCDHEVTQSEYKAVMGSNPSSFSSSPLSGEIQGNRPVEYVSWYDAIYFCNKKSEKDGYDPCYSVNGNTDTTKWNYTPNAGNSISGVVSCDFNASGYRLPTEAEWEFAARGGTETYGKTAFANYFAGAATTYPSASTNSDLAPVGWYTANSSNKTHEVKKKTANVLELYDMSGNVWEWCWDWYGTISSGTVNDPTGAASGSNKSMRGGSSYANANDCSVSYRSYGSAAYRYSYLGFRLVCSGK